MRKLISLLIGCVIASLIYIHLESITGFLGETMTVILLIYVIALGIIHIGGISLKILAVVFAIIEPYADKYCYWYENTKFYKFFHKNEIR